MSKIKRDLIALYKWFHPEEKIIKKYLENIWKKQAITGLKLLAFILFLLAIISLIIIHIIPTSYKSGLLISIKFFVLSLLLIFILKNNSTKKYAKTILFIAMIYLICDNLYLQLTEYINNKTQIGLFIASICFISFTFLPYRSWVLALFSLLTIIAIIIICKILNITINPYYNTHIFWLIIQLTALCFISILFKSAIINMQLNIYKTTEQINQINEELDDIKKLLTSNENKNLEFKSSIRWDYYQNKVNKALEFSVLKSIVAFLNTNGGTLIIGIDDNKNILGLEKDYETLKKKDKDGFEAYLIQIIKEKIDINICSYIHIKFLNLNEKEICIIKIKKANAPVYLNNQNENLFFIRTGNITSQLDAKNTVEYIKNHWQN
ncbi:MAG TPA: ATP-binding protein [bacterium]|nr:ATP-binding protein [bacterium]HOL47983.1 ATP-binding protein [bacterium]HPQ19205.1 ATP-binding protein [bacterium]